MAADAPITGAPLRASINRRNVIAALAATPAIAAASLPPSWDMRDWVRRWGALGSGLRVDSHGNLAFTIRAGTEAKACELLAELGRVGSAEKLRAAIQALDNHCGALAAVERMHAIDREFVSHDVDPSRNAEWLDRWEAAAWRLSRTPARGAPGLAAKLREGIEMNGSELGQSIVSSALSQLSLMA